MESSQSLIAQLQDILGEPNVSTHHDDCVLMAQDVFTKARPA